MVESGLLRQIQNVKSSLSDCIARLRENSVMLRVSAKELRKGVVQMNLLTEDMAKAWSVLCTAVNEFEKVCGVRKSTTPQSVTEGKELMKQAGKQALESDKGESPASLKLKANTIGENLERFLESCIERAKVIRGDAKAISKGESKVVAGELIPEELQNEWRAILQSVDALWKEHKGEMNAEAPPTNASEANKRLQRLKKSENQRLSDLENEREKKEEKKTKEKSATKLAQEKKLKEKKQPIIKTLEEMVSICVKGKGHSVPLKDVKGQARRLIKRLQSENVKKQDQQFVDGCAAFVQFVQHGKPKDYQAYKSQSEVICLGFGEIADEILFEFDAGRFVLEKKKPNPPRIPPPAPKSDVPVDEPRVREPSSLPPKPPKQTSTPFDYNIKLDTLEDKLLSRGYESLCYYLAKAEKDQGAENFFKLLFLGARYQVQTSSSKLFDSFWSEIEEGGVLPEYFGDKWMLGGVNASLGQLSLASSLLVPAVIGPQSIQVRSYLSELSFGSKNPLAPLFQSLRGLQGEVSSQDVGAAIGSGNIDAKLLNLEKKADGLLQIAKNKSTSHSATTKVFKQWGRPSGKIGKLITVVKEGRRKNAEETRKLAIELDKEWHSLLRKEVKGKLNGQATEKVKQFVGDVVGLVAEWADSCQANQHGTVRQGLHEVIEKLKETKRFETDVPARIRSQLRSARYILLGEGERGNFAEVQMNTDLLRLPGVPINPDTEEPSKKIEIDFRRELEEFVKYERADWASTCERSIDANDFWKANRILEILAIESTGKTIQEKIKSELAMSLDAFCDLTRHQIEVVKLEMEEISSELSEEEKEDVSARLIRCENHLDEKEPIGSFVKWVLEEAQELVRTSRKRAKEEILERLGGIKHKVSKEDRAFIENAVAEGMFVEARDGLEFLEAGKELPKRVDSGVDLERFGRITRGLAREEIVWDDLIHAFKHGRQSFNIKPMGTPNPKSEQVKMLEAWHQMAEHRSEIAVSPKNIRLVLGGLGFGLGKVSRTGPPFVARVETIEDGTICPLPFWGSEARGTYDIFCVGKGESLIDKVRRIDTRRKNQPNQNPLILFVFKWLTEGERKKVLNETIKRKLPLLLVDNSVMAYHFDGVVGENAIQKTLGCTLPYSFQKSPFFKESSKNISMATELFVGREREMARIISPSGGCLLYGGRQVGKTALLRDVVRTFHNPESQHFCFFDDIEEAFDYDCGAILDRVLLKRMREVWESLGLTFKPESWESFLARVEETFKEREDLRVILLLDESDVFLDLDNADEFRWVGRFHQLMSQTNSRFKVVFSGLHNVQRASRESNSTLYHWGDPICVRPFISNAEKKLARQLLSRPFKVCGVELPPSLVNTAVGLSNYYPKLLQFMGNRLWNQLSFGAMPVWEPNQKDWRKILQDKVAFKGRKEVFNLTLDLDPRYHFLALSFGYKEFESSAFDSTSLREIRNHSKEFWPNAFKDEQMDVIQFEVLLDEMEGLGILRHSDAGAWHLRTANLLPLLGTREHIYEALFSFHKKKVTKIPKPEIHRVSLSSDERLLAPLPVNQLRQISTFTKVPASASEDWHLQDSLAIVVGSPAAGSEDLLQFLQEGSRCSNLVTCLTIKAISRFVKQKWVSLKGRETFVFIDPAVNWNIDTIESVSKWLGTRHSKTKKRVRFIFAASPRRWEEVQWNLSPMRIKLLNQASHYHFSLFTVRPWHDKVRKSWIEACNLEAVIPADSIHDLAGRWASFLYVLREKGVSEFNPSPADFGMEGHHIDCLRIFNEWGPLTEEEFDEICREGDSRFPCGDFRTSSEFLQWALILSFIEPVTEVEKIGKEEIYRIDPVVSRVIMTQGESEEDG